MKKTEEGTLIRQIQRRGGGSMTAGPEIGVMGPRAKECQQSLDGRRGKGGVSLRDSGGTASLLAL